MASLVNENERVTAVVNAHRDVVTRSLRSFGVPDADVDDAAQQTFCVLARRIDEVPPGKERPFLFGVALRIAQASARERRTRSELHDDVVLGSLAIDEPGPDDQLDAARARAKVSAALAEMPAELRDVFVLHELERMTMAEIADAEGLRPGTVASRLRRARTTFARVIAGVVAALVLYARRSAALVPAATALVVGVLLFCPAPPAPAPAPAPPPPVAIVATTTAAPEPEPEPVLELPPDPVPAARPKPRPIPKVVHDDELTLVQRARTQLAAGASDEARATLAERDRLYPAGALAMECEVLAIDLLVAAGDSAGAQRAKAAFLLRHPQSPYAERLR